MFYSVCYAQGPREYMEDTFSVNVINKYYTLFGVYDGHGGGQVSDMLKKEIAQQLEIILKSNPDIDLYTTFNDLFLLFDHKSKEFKSNVGSTSSVALILNNRILFANCGDTLTMVGLRNERRWLSVSQEHKASSEIERIEALGGSVLNIYGMHRVNGMLNMSRSIGDHHLKPYVIANPYVTSMSTNEIEFILIASDGLWDVFTMDQVYINIKTNINLLQKSGLSKNDAADKVIYQLIQQAYLKGSMDNITIIYIEIIK